ncbi:MAG TPA: aldehyde dehydrogenase family protein, partial [Acidimicrobiales bacterium]
MSAEVTMTIDGVASSTEATFDVINPATGAPEATAPDCTPQQLDAAMASAAKAYRDWRRDESRRRDMLRQCADALMAAANDIAPLLTLEQG